MTKLTVLGYTNKLGPRSLAEQLVEVPDDGPLSIVTQEAVKRLFEFIEAEPDSVKLQRIEIKIEY